MPVIFGKEIQPKTLWIGGGLMAAAVAVVVFLRARAAANAQQEAPQPQPQPQDMGAGMSIPAPTGQVADQYQQQIDNTQLEAQKIANQYQQNLVDQQQKQFEFQMKMQEQIEPDILANEQSQLAVGTHYNKTVAKTKIRCPKGQSLAADPTGALTCYAKGSGIPIVTDLLRFGEGVVSGAAQEAPNIGKQAAEDAYKYALGKVIPQRTVSPNSGNPAARPAPQQQPQTFTPDIAPHGYIEIA